MLLLTTSMKYILCKSYYFSFFKIGTRVSRRFFPLVPDLTEAQWSRHLHKPRTHSAWASPNAKYNAVPLCYHWSHQAAWLPPPETPPTFESPSEVLLYLIKSCCSDVLEEVFQVIQSIFRPCMLIDKEGIIKYLFKKKMAFQCISNVQHICCTQVQRAITWHEINFKNKLCSNLFQLSFKKWTVPYGT